MLHKLLFALVVTVSVASWLFPFVAEPPLAYVTSFFAIRHPFLLFGCALGIFFIGGVVEKRLGPWNLALVWVLASAVPLALPALGVSVSPAVAGMGGLLGAVVAADPYALVIVFNFFPVPAFLGAVAVLAFNFLVVQEFQAVPLLVGLLYGYLAASASPGAPQATPPRYAGGRY
ncbi:MAG: hypothetical protein V1787_00625 [Candidatus Micrarchaeota archaeon]